jgi:hypothetical protein
LDIEHLHCEIRSKRSVFQMLGKFGELLLQSGRQGNTVLLEKLGPAMAGKVE